MKFRAEIDIMPLKALLDPQGKAVSQSMKNLHLAEISNVRIGKHISLEVEAVDKNTAQSKVDEACKKLLANQIMESYNFELVETRPMVFDSFYVSMLSEKYKNGSLLKGFLTGLKSNWLAKEGSYSSQIYILKRKSN